MPASGRGSHPLASATLTSAELSPGVAGRGWADVAVNYLCGGALAATVDPNPGHRRVRVELYWPGVRTAHVVRVHADGATSPVRNAEPAPVNTGWVGYDHEAPLDVPVTYRATSSTAAGAVVDSPPVTLPSLGRGWLTHPAQPRLGLPVRIQETGPRAYGARRGVARPPERADPIVIHAIRQTPTSTVVLQTDGTFANAAAVEALIADGAALLLRYPAAWGGHTMYVSVDTVEMARLEPRSGTMADHLVTVPFDVLTRPDGASAGAVGASYADDTGTYGQDSAAGASYADHLTA